MSRGTVSSIIRSVLARNDLGKMQFNTVLSAAGAVPGTTGRYNCSTPATVSGQKFQEPALLALAALQAML
jgi:hypothetical protein